MISLYMCCGFRLIYKNAALFSLVYMFSLHMPYLGFLDESDELCFGV